MAIYRLTHVDPQETSWDVFGYYLPLPATFVHGDPMLHETEWVEQVRRDRELPGTLYTIARTDEGAPMYFFLFGMALFYLPFFLLAHLIAYLSGTPPDGFGMIYQYLLVIGGLCYTLIGLVYFRKVLRHYFSEGLTALLILLIVVGTNYVHHMTLKNLETVNILFMLVSLVIWYTIQWHETHRYSHLMIISLASALMVLVKPSEALVVLIPLLWNTGTKAGRIAKWSSIRKHYLQLVMALVVGALVLLPQLAYWYMKTGQLLFDSYQNPGIGLDLSAPHWLETLFSYRKGWLLYTPLMVFALLGLVPLYRLHKAIFPAVFFYFMASFYIISSWTEWWYGAGFSNRPLIVTYPLLAIALGSWLEWMSVKGKLVKLGFSMLLACLVALNQFQWWQHKAFILHPYLTTKAYYWQKFLSTSFDESNDRPLLMVDRDFSGGMRFSHPEWYKEASNASLILDNLALNKDACGVVYCSINPDQEFVLTDKMAYNKLTEQDHIWIRVSLDIRFPNGAVEEKLPHLVWAMERSEGHYGYYAMDLKPAEWNTEWHHMEFDYLTPYIRSNDDLVVRYIWNPGGATFDIKDARVIVFERKPL